tara:strand:+ start:141 stop:2717 length:2577 start_codon:yes stop_codon:yes gene_type:complete
MRDENNTPNDLATVSVAAKERLARLLASENIAIEHRKVPTAAFDVKNRVLILPMWKEMSPALYDLLVGHEDGHALFTPYEGWHGACEGMSAGYRSFLNVIEDARIEKKVKRKFPGIRKSFNSGYKELLDRDFFGIKDRDVNSMGLIDRINIHFKGGSALGVKFSDAEMVYVDRIAKAESWDEVVAIADDLWDEAQDAAETNPGHSDEPGQLGDDDGEDTGDGGSASFDDTDDDSDDTDGDFGNPDDTDGDSDSDDDAPSGDSPSDTDADDGDSDDADNKGKPDDNDDVDSKDDADDTSGSADNNGSDDDSSSDDTDGDDGDSDDGGDGSTGDKAGSGDGNNVTSGEPFSETDKAFRENENQLVDNDPAMEFNYVTVPKDAAFNLDSLIVPPSVIHDALLGAVGKYSASWLDRYNDAPNTFKKANSKTVGYLAKEFEMRKAADASARTSTARTGVLDTNTLHSFKWNDDVFKKVTNIPDGKSHGLVMFVDWSGSMSRSMEGTIDQAVNIAMFCKKVNIPFDVYAFTSGLSNKDRAERVYSDHNFDSEIDKSIAIGPTRGDNEAMDEGSLRTGDYTLNGSSSGSFGLLNLMSSKSNRAEWTKSLKGMLILRDAFDPNGYRTRHIPNWLGLGGTPLNEAILAAIPIVNKLRADNALQIVNTVFLTDGEGSDLWHVHDRPGASRGYKTTIIRDDVSRKEYKVTQDRYVIQDRYGYGSVSKDSQMGVLLDVLRNRTGSKVVNFYVTDPRPMNFKRELAARLDLTEDEKDTMRRRGNDLPAVVNDLYKAAKKDGGITITNTTVWDHEYLIFGGDNLLSSDDEEGLDEALTGAAKGKLKSAFAKAATNKLKTRIVLRKFTEMIAA